MKNQAFLWRCGATAMLISVLVTLGCPLNTTRAAVSIPPDPPERISPRTPPPWWYAPDKPLWREARALEAPDWWYEPAKEARAASPFEPATSFTDFDIAVEMPGGQQLNAGIVPLTVRLTANGITPDVIVQVTSEQVPEQAVYASYEKTPSGTIQNLGGFQQAKFMGGVSPDYLAEVTFKYEPLTTGWFYFNVVVWMGDNQIYQQHHGVHINPVTPTFNTFEPTVTLGNHRPLNAGAIPLEIAVTADGPTPDIVVQVSSEDVPERAVYVGKEKTPDGAIQNLRGWQQARFRGGVGPDNLARVIFNYEPLATGWLYFNVIIWMGDTQIYQQHHGVHINPVTPTFSNFETTVDFGANSQGFNAGFIPLHIRVTADGATPDILIRVSSEDVPERAIYAGYEKSPEGAIQNLNWFQQTQFRGGVGPDGVADVLFKYEPLALGWVNYEVSVEMGGNMVYGPARHFIYIKPSGSPSMLFPPLIQSFDVAAETVSEDARSVTFSADLVGNPDPQYELSCGEGAAAPEVLSDATFVCHYRADAPGVYVAQVTAANDDGETRYTTVATKTVLVPASHSYLPLIRK